MSDAMGHGVYRAVCLDGRLHTFRLTTGAWQELEERVKCGAKALFRKLSRDDYNAIDQSHIIFMGLVGAGMPADKADRLVKRWVIDQPMIPFEPLCYKIVAASILPIRGEDLDAADESSAEEEDKEIDYSHFYKSGAAMGFSPDQVDRMTFAQFRAAVQGVNKANSTGDEVTFPTGDQYEAFRAEVAERNERNPPKPAPPIEGDHGVMADGK